MPPRTPDTGRDRLLAPVARTPLSFALAAVCIGALAWVEIHGESSDPATLVRSGALERGRVWSGEVWRLLSGPFLHAGWIHLGLNVAVGVPWCRLVERALGPARFLLVYLASALGASALSLLGQDAVSAGASGALFGVVGATLALHRRALGSWAAFARSDAARKTLLGIAAWSVLGGLLLPLDQLAHGGGLGVGATAAWLLSRPRPARALPWALFAAALAALAVAAAWPRAGPSRFQAMELEQALREALRAEDAPGARRLLARAEALGQDSERLRSYRAFLLVQEGDLEEAMRLLRPLRGATEPGVRAEATELARGVAKQLAYRYASGDGGPRNPWLADAYLEEACALGDEESCRSMRPAGGRGP
jgi:membrane associated rhomboid family serine protease